MQLSHVNYRPCIINITNGACTLKQIIYKKDNFINNVALYRYKLGDYYFNMTIVGA